MSTLEKAKKVNLDAGLDPNYTELDPNYTDDMDEFELTSISNSTLRELIAYCGREEFIEEKKENPDQIKIQKLISLTREIYADERASDFNNRDDMVNLIKKYMPMLRRVNLVVIWHRFYFDAIFIRAI